MCSSYSEFITLLWLKKQQDVAYRYATLLHNVWIKSFSEKYVICLTALKKKLIGHLKNYSNKVQKAQGSKRINMKIWMRNNNQLLDLFKKNIDPNKLKQSKRDYYYDQKYLNRQIILREEIQPDDKLAKEQEIEEMDLSSDDILEDKTIQQSNSFSMNRSGINRQSKDMVDMSTQTDEPHTFLKPLRSGSRNFCESIKSALALSCSYASITTEQARKAFQITSEVFFGIKYYLSPEQKYKDLQFKKNPRTRADYNNNYTDVLPSSKVIAETKHLLAIQQERNAALAILDRSEEATTLQFDTTSRKRINGEWPSIIMRMKNGKKFRLRPLSMAVETRENITSLIVASLKRLSIAGETSTIELWKKVTALMTDSVSKNLHLEEQIANTLQSVHVPLHLLCVSHTCEVFDRGNISILCEIEQNIGLREILIQHMPILKSFLSKNKCVTIAAIEAFSKLVTNDGHKSSYHEEFNHVLNINNKSKKFSVFKERRFAQLGYTAASITFHLQDFNAVLENPRSNNVLVQACRLYINVDFILVALKCLAWFTKKVTLPFLNMCEMKEQSDLLKILPKLKDSLQSIKLDNLQDFEVDYSFEVEEPQSPLGKHIIKEFCKKAAIDLTTQRGREYGFSEYSEPRATDLTKLSKNQLDGLPTNNLDCERDLAKFDHLAKRSASCSSKKFTAKGIRDEITLLDCNKSHIEKVTKSIKRILDKEEKAWAESQNILTEVKLKNDVKKAAKQIEYVHLLLAKCKKHGGPFISINEVETNLKVVGSDTEKKRILRAEILYRRHTSTKDFQNRPHLYKVNQLSLIEMKINIATIITNPVSDLKEIPTLPTEEEVMQMITVRNEPMKNNITALGIENFEPKVNELCIVMWDEKNIRNWYVAMCQKRLNANQFYLEHLECISSENIKRCWRYPKKSDEQIAELDQIIPVNILGVWNRKGRITVFELDNWHVIDGFFQGLYIN